MSVAANSAVMRKCYTCGAETENFRCTTCIDRSIDMAMKAEDGMAMKAEDDTMPDFEKLKAVPCNACKHLAKFGEPFCKRHLRVETKLYTSLTRKEQKLAWRTHRDDFPLYAAYVRCFSDMVTRRRPCTECQPEKKCKLA